MSGPKKILIMNGPNLNLLGSREPEVYGYDTLDDIKGRCETLGSELGFQVDFRHSNSEGEMVNWIQESRTDHAGIIINPAAYSHTSIAILDSLLASEIPIIEVHLSNIHQRESYRQHSYVSKAAKGVICGLGAQGYDLAMRAMAQLLEKK
ncbi:MAG: type II 3-dehydroquinate dehydratase [Alphaproteobacteria bacterium]|nr:type II 3-dehydroquinate dehydratase [Alphaproteobacteria bacterium]